MIARLAEPISEAIGYCDRVGAKSGRFRYRVDPVSGASLGGYNILRHCGLTLELFNCLRADARFAVVGPRADRALSYIAARTSRKEHMAWIESRKCTKLGAAALAALAWLSASEAGHTHQNDDFEPFLNFICSWQLCDGSFISKADRFTGQVDEFQSQYYPAQAVLALARGAVRIGRDEYGARAIKGLTWIAQNCPAAIAPDGSFRGHWEAKALAAIEALVQPAMFAERARLIARATVYDAPVLDLARYSTSEIATRMECIGALIRLRGSVFDFDEAWAMSDFLATCSAELLARQIDERSGYHPVARGGFVSGPRNRTIRIDCVQHSIAALLEAAEATEMAGDEVRIAAGRYYLDGAELEVRYVDNAD